jgi:imidazole glycerol-phosphate synthase subunit HisF
MKKNRLIPVLLLKNGWLVQSKGFCKHQNLGNPITAVERLSEWASDELIYLDISKDDTYDTRRNDQGYENRGTFIDIIRDVSRVTFMPITVGGKIRSLKDIEYRLSAGADKVSINTAAIIDPDFIKEASNEFGSQCIVVSIDAKKVDDVYRVFANGGSDETNLTPDVLARKVELAGAGEIIINSIDNDGVGRGYDLKLVGMIADAVNIPVIACGGVGEWDHFSDAFTKTKADAVSAANIFHYRDQSVYLAKKHLYDLGLNVRKPDIIKIKKR